MSIHILSDSIGVQENGGAGFQSATTEILSAMIQGQGLEAPLADKVSAALNTSHRSEEEVSPHSRRHRPAASDRLLASAAEKSDAPKCERRHLKTWQKLPVLRKKAEGQRGS